MAFEEGSVFFDIITSLIKLHEILHHLFIRQMWKLRIKSKSIDSAFKEFFNTFSKTNADAGKLKKAVETVFIQIYTDKKAKDVLSVDFVTSISRNLLKGNLLSWRSLPRL